MFTIFFKPENYKQIDKYLSRSAQPTLKELKWLKKHGVTDVVNLRTMEVPDINYNEAQAVKELGMTYHNIPSISMYPKKENVGKFLDIVEGVKQNGGKVHVHCKEGADRTGMFSYIYERLNNIGTIKDNLQELIDHNWHKDKYPYLNEWAETFVGMFKKK